ncbi:MAG: NTP transferase domain-containing protein [Parvularculaceae bacterium]
MTGNRAVEKRPRRFGFILAGGRARRMGGADKAEVVLARRRLIDRVLSRLASQLDGVLICGPETYDCSVEAVTDRPEGPAGPAAGVFAAERWIRARAPDCGGFLTAPVDGPFLPDDLAPRLVGVDGSAFAADSENDHPTFAYWTLEALARAWPALESKGSISMRALADACGARRVVWNDPYTFFNVNSPEDLKTAEAILRDRPTLA